ncbi:UPF0276 protein [Marinobacterium nitratireducens]|uniref:UPF0276 protein GCM10011348_06040 n=1 Tax=Marinobacterium nitratireducens TaxID=518897 RepID=A0A917Z7V5_9GAMM|nr:DUF692 domain-containing protein [Marinobacterium nitratireducens]GGO77141.1 UPF0276 protein [Marinobacterium nitratireducens]
MTVAISPGSTSDRAPAKPALPPRAGISLKPEHYRDILDSRPDIGFVEVHAENYLVDGGPYHYYLNRIREDYALSIHGVGMNIGGEQPLDAAHLDRIAGLLERYQPACFSEHLAWTSHGGIYFNDLLPLNYDSEALQRVCEHIDQVQNRLQRQILLENPATYVEFGRSTMAEAEFIGEVVMRSGCGLLLDVNNVHVTCTNHNLDPDTYIRQLPLGQVGEIHLAGFSREQDADGATLLIDSHDAPVSEAVWTLYEDVLGRCGAKPTLIERDGNIPPLPTLHAEARHAESLLKACQEIEGS